MNTLHIFTDGGARGNPGPAASGVAIFAEDRTVIAEIGKYLGIATNNVAEYTAVLLAHEWLSRHAKDTTNVRFFLDSLLVCSQLQGVYKIKEPSLLSIRKQIAMFEQHLISRGILVTYEHVRREFNKAADALVNKTLDEMTK